MSAPNRTAELLAVSEAVTIAEQVMARWPDAPACMTERAGCTAAITTALLMGYQPSRIVRALWVVDPPEGDPSEGGMVERWEWAAAIAETVSQGWSPGPDADLVGWARAYRQALIAGFTEPGLTWPGLREDRARREAQCLVIRASNGKRWDDSQAAALIEEVQTLLARGYEACVITPALAALASVEAHSEDLPPEGLREILHRYAEVNDRFLSGRFGYPDPGRPERGSAMRPRTCGWAVAGRVPAMGEHVRSDSVPAYYLDDPTLDPTTDLRVPDGLILVVSDLASLPLTGGWIAVYAHPLSTPEGVER